MQKLLSAHRTQIESTRQHALCAPISAPPRFHHVRGAPGYARADSIVYLNDMPRDISDSSFVSMLEASVKEGQAPPVFSRFDAVNLLTCQITIVYFSASQALAAAAWWRSVHVPTALADFPCQLRVTCQSYLERSFSRMGFFTPDPGALCPRRFSV